MHLPNCIRRLTSWAAISKVPEQTITASIKPSLALLRVQNKSIVFVAGEESGDRHAADLIQALLTQKPDLVISGIGGQHMRDAGAEVIYDLARFGVTGLVEVIRHARTIREAFKRIKAHLIKTKPDLLVLVDYPGFNLRLAQFAKKTLGLTILYYISPQIWAWKANRLQTIRQCVDHMASILPFEKPLYEHAGIPVSFVGHPLVKTLPACTDMASTRLSLGLPQNKKIIALLPGSRRNEIDRLLPVMVKTMQALLKQHDDVHFILPVAASLSFDSIQRYVPESLSNHLTLLKEQAIKAMIASDCVVVASGTASLECALLTKPMCIVYNVSRLTYMTAMQFIKVKYLGLCNLLANKMLVPELLQDDYNPKELTDVVNALAFDTDYATAMAARLETLKRGLSAEKADCQLVALVMGLLSNTLNPTAVNTPST